MEAENYSEIDVSSSRNEVGKKSETQGVYGEATIDMPIMEAMHHNKKAVPSSICGTGQSGEKQEIQGSPHDINKMEARNHIKIGANVRTMRQEKKKKVIDH